MQPGILTLTTDFGHDGPYVAAMKGVVLGLAPGTQLVDVSHTVTPQNILEGAFVLSDIVEAFPPRTVHLAVVDPGVGTDRRLIAVSVARQWFVLPDNGVISGVTRNRKPDGVWELTNPAIQRPKVSATFHGRDILAPAAAHLVLGRDPAELGPPRNDLVTLRNFNPEEDGNGFLGEVIFRDSFGNLITNIHADRLGPLPSDDWAVELAGVRIDGVRRTYGESAPRSLIALTGSSGWLEVAVVNGDAARQLTAGVGTTVWVRKTNGVRR
jgi:S-adenosylmethionine hydrolase